LSVVLAEKRDLAFGTSRWSSKLVHGGLRYLATGNIGIAWRSAAERGILMTRNAPHLVHAMAQLVPLLPSMGRSARALVRTGFVAGDGLRRLAPRPRLCRAPDVSVPSAPWRWCPGCVGTGSTAPTWPTTVS
jgi:glycerol-3-phosphate dehydrogenase